MNDDQVLDVITDSFMRELLKHRFEDKKSYRKLFRRISILIRIELNWQKRRAWEKQMMSAWGPSCN